MIFRGESFAGLYEVSTEGAVRLACATHKSPKGHVLSPAPMNGYPGVQLYRVRGGEKNRVTAQVHRLVLETFMGPPAPGQQCNHKSGDKTDNRLANVEWVTPSENRLHAFTAGLQERPAGERNAAAKLTDAQVLEIRRLRALPKAERPAQQDVADQFGISRPLVSMIENGVIWPHLPFQKPARRERVARS